MDNLSTFDIWFLIFVMILQITFGYLVGYADGKIGRFSRKNRNWDDFNMLNELLIDFITIFVIIPILLYSIYWVAFKFK